MLVIIVAQMVKPGALVKTTTRRWDPTFVESC